MKRIVKDDEPLDFAGWKGEDKMAHRPNWNRVPRPVRESNHGSLLREQGYICCYCESEISKNDNHVEHFRPRKFKEHQLDYENLHCSCQRKTAKGEPRHCGHLKGRWFDEALLISPLDEDCERRFRYTANGDIFPRMDGDVGAETTIGRLGLDLPKLRDFRSAAIDAFHDLSVEEVGQMLGREPGEGYAGYLALLSGKLKLASCLAEATAFAWQMRGIG